MAIAGYTNAGKSSLLNRLTGADLLVDNSLFATLDPAVRRARTPAGRPYTLTDTVGFVRHLPHQLVEAFRSTLEEVADADLILHVVDGSDADPAAQLAAVREVLGQIGAGDVPELVVINKADLADPAGVAGLRTDEKGAVVVSARTGAGLDELRAELDRMLPRRDTEVCVLVPYDRGDLVSRAHAEGEVAGRGARAGRHRADRAGAPGARRGALRGGPAGRRDRRPRGCRGRPDFLTGQERIPPQRPVIRAGTAMSRPGGI